MSKPIFDRMNPDTSTIPALPESDRALADKFAPGFECRPKQKVEFTEADLQEIDATWERNKDSGALDRQREYRASMLEINRRDK